MQNFPDELLLEIFQYLEYWELKCISLVNRRMYMMLLPRKGQPDRYDEILFRGGPVANIPHETTFENMRFNPMIWKLWYRPFRKTTLETFALMPPKRDTSEPQGHEPNNRYNPPEGAIPLEQAACRNESIMSPAISLITLYVVERGDRNSRKLGTQLSSRCRTEVYGTGNGGAITLMDLAEAFRKIVSGTNKRPKYSIREEYQWDGIEAIDKQRGWLTMYLRIAEKAREHEPLNFKQLDRWYKCSVVQDVVLRDFD